MCEIFFNLKLERNFFKRENVTVNTFLIINTHIGLYKAVDLICIKSYHNEY